MSEYTHTETNHPAENNYPKLVRDRIPERIKEQGKQVQTRVLSEEEFAGYLLTKLIEEATELSEAEAGAHQLEELADVFEVLETLLSLKGITRADVAAVQTQKREERGGFTERILMLGKPE